MRRFGFFLQLCLLTFGIIAHALTLDASAVSADALYERITGESPAAADPIADRPDTFRRADFPLAKTRLVETGPFEKEEEEEIRTNGVSFKIITTSGSGTSAFFCAHNRPEPVLDALLATDPSGVATAGAAIPRRILYQVFRI